MAKPMGLVRISRENYDVLRRGGLITQRVPRNFVTDVNEMVYWQFSDKHGGTAQVFSVKEEASGDKMLELIMKEGRH